MKHFYQDIFGYFDFQSFYTEMVENASDNEHWVEVGAYRGQSTSYLAVEIINSGKNIILDVIDTWKGSAVQQKGEICEDKDIVAMGNIYNIFIENMKPVLDYTPKIINPIMTESVKAAATYEDASLDFVFIDAEHQEESVYNDIKAWLPKIKPGGIIAGHDYSASQDVGRAVLRVFGEEGKDFYLHPVCISCWIHKKKG